MKFYAFNINHSKYKGYDVKHSKYKAPDSEVDKETNENFDEKPNKKIKVLKKSRMHLA